MSKEKPLKIRYNNGKMQIMDDKVPGGKVTVGGVKGYVPSPNHVAFKLYDEDEGATVYSFEDITQDENSKNRLQMLVTVKPGEKPEVSVHQKLKKHPCGENAAKAAGISRKMYYTIASQNAHY